MKTTIDAAGRLVVPREVRRAAGLEGGAVVDVRFVHGRIEIEPEPLQIRLEQRGHFTVAVPAGEIPTMKASDVEQTREALLDDRSS